MRTRFVFSAVVVLCLLVPTSLFADFQYTETTRITGGAIVGMMKVAGAFSKQARQVNEPFKTTVLLKGNRMARISPNETEIIDLDSETFTRIDPVKKQYSVMTFAQMKQQIEDAAKDARKKQGTEDGAPQMSFKVKVRNTNATKQVGAFSTKEAILTMMMEAKDQKSGEKGGLAITSDMWLAPDIPGYSEVRDFERRLALKMGLMTKNAFGPMLAAMQPGSSQGLAELTKEMSKLNGVPVLQIMRMGTSSNGQPLPAASEAPLPEPKQQETPDVGEAAKESAKENVVSGIAGKLGGLGGFGGFGRKKKKEEAQPKAEEPKPSQTEQTQAAPAVLMEANVELADFSSSAVAGGRFEIPAGYKQVQAK